jgi:hypothetical protein
VSEEQKPGASPSDELQFEQVEYESAAPASATCAVCGQPIKSVYYDVNGNPACTDCRDQLSQRFSGGSAQTGRVVRALVFGAVAAALGAGIYYGIRVLTNMEFGLIAIVVGLMVGGAVKKGSDGLGGWFYQAMAMFLTYTAIVSTYVPLVVKAVHEHEATQVADGKGKQAAGQAGKDSADAKVQPKPTVVGFFVAIVMLIGFIYALPFLAGAQNIMGLIIIGIGLYEAWAMNRRAPLVITGPYQLRPANPLPPP